jgi:hypothetical protein
VLRAQLKRRAIGGQCAGEHRGNEKYEALGELHLCVLFVRTGQVPAPPLLRRRCSAAVRRCSAAAAVATPLLCPTASFSTAKKRRQLGVPAAKRVRQAAACLDPTIRREPPPTRPTILYGLTVPVSGPMTLVQLRALRSAALTCTHSPGLWHGEKGNMVSMLAMRGPAGAAGRGGQCGTREPNARVGTPATMMLGPFTLDHDPPQS